MPRLRPCPAARGVRTDRVFRYGGRSKLLSANAQTNTYGDLLEQGVIDPVKVVRSALENAASVAALMLTTEALVAEKPKEEKPAAGGHNHGEY